MLHRRVGISSTEQEELARQRLSARGDQSVACEKAKRFPPAPPPPPPPQKKEWHFRKLSVAGEKGLCYTVRQSELVRVRMGRE